MKMRGAVRPLRWMQKIRNQRKERRLERAQQKAEALNRIDLAEEEARKLVEASGEFGEDEFLDEIYPPVQGDSPERSRDRPWNDIYSGHIAESPRLVAGTLLGGPPVERDAQHDNLTINGTNGNSMVSTDVRMMHHSYNDIEFFPEEKAKKETHKPKRHSVKVTKSDMTTLPTSENVLKTVRIKEWASRFRRADPRYQIAAYFDEVAHKGMKDIPVGIVDDERITQILNMLYRSSVFTVWRPTSMDSIKKMMKGQGVGKGLDIKGKSAKCGALSGFVPFLQVSEEKHKRMIRTLAKNATMRIFYSTEALRDLAARKLAEVGEEMLVGWTQAQSKIATQAVKDNDLGEAVDKFMWDMEDPEILLLDEYAEGGNPVFGVQLPQRLFWEAYVMRNDIHREPGSPNDTGRPSVPSFQDMNFAALKNVPIEGRPRPVVFQCSQHHAMCPLNLVVAYEENNKVSPVVSDFDCFLVGTRGVAYEESIPKSQITLVKWCINRIDETLAGAPQAAPWTARWLKVLKEYPIRPNMPQYGFGDPKSYWLMEQAIERLSKDGCVRHGAECFNYYFPQELDDHFLVINDMRHDTGSPWKYVSVVGLQEILLRKIVEGYTFPLNPKWILCDPGWKKIYDAMMASEATHVQDSLNCWYPPDSGIREMIEDVYAKHPSGFIRDMVSEEALDSTTTALSELEEMEENDGTAAMDLAEQALRHYEVFQRAKRKLKAVLIWMRFVVERQQEAAERQARKAANGVRDTAIARAPKRLGEVSLRASIHHSVVRNSIKACDRPVQHFRVCAPIRKTPLIDEIRRGHSFAANESPKIDLLPKRFVSMEPARLSTSVESNVLNNDDIEVPAPKDSHWKLSIEGITEEDEEAIEDAEP